jgi:hypothetical protein
MVKCCFFVFVLVLACLLSVSSISSANAQSLSYTVDHEWVQIYINQDGSIDLIYNITLTVNSGSVGGFYVGQPKADFTIGEAVDQYGNILFATDASSGSDYRVDVTLNERLQVGQSIWFTLPTNVAGMIYNDTINPGNYGMQFIPQWISDTPISDVRVQIVLPPGVELADVKTTQERYYNGTSTVEGRTAVFWQIGDIGANEQVQLGVSFPASSMPNYTPVESSGGGGSDFFYIALVILAAIAVFVAIIVLFYLVYRSSKRSYQTPKVTMETLGVKRGLTAVEASYLLDIKPPQIVTEILYSLLQKRAVWVEQSKPSLRLKVLPPYENKTGSQQNPLRYYEIDFLQALKSDGALDEEKLAKCIMFLRDTVESKLEGYSRKDTVDYYRKIVDKAWGQVEQAGTTELASNAYDKELLWLMIDPNQRARTETTFRERPFQPQPLWFWWWYGYTIYHPHPVYMPNVSAPSQSPTPAAVPGAEFANNIATAVENTSNGIVANLEKFANSIVPPPPKVSQKPAHNKADCVCACAACACACACVSCACACAGGGAH